KIKKTVLAEDHPSQLVSQHELAMAYHANGQVKEAVQLLEHVVKIKKTVLAEDHPDQLASQNELARAYQANGQIKEAVQLLEHVVKIEKTTLAEDHPNRLASQHALARAHQEYEKTQSTGRSPFFPCYTHSIKHFTRRQKYCPGYPTLGKTVAWRVAERSK